jgi:hypothetical protein
LHFGNTINIPLHDTVRKPSGKPMVYLIWDTNGNLLGTLLVSHWCTELGNLHRKLIRKPMVY